MAPFLNGEQFDPETKAAISTAYRACCQRLGLTDGANSINAVLASHVIEAARTGAHEPGGLYELAMESFKVGWAGRKIERPF